MLTRMQTWMIVALALTVLCTWLWLNGEQPTPRSLFGKLGLVVSLVYGGMLLFGTYAWSWRIFKGWLVKRPDLRGTWRATLNSDWKHPVTKTTISPIEAYIVVRQTLAMLSMRFFTVNARSVLIAHNIEPEPDGLFTLSAVYRNSPRIERQGVDSAIHHGSLLIEVHETKPKKLEGHYWTDRGTRGTIILEWKNDGEFTSFDDAKAAAGGS